MKSSGLWLRGTPALLILFFSVDLVFYLRGGGGERRIFVCVCGGGGGGGGWGKNILTYLFKYCRGFTCLASASGETLLKIFLGGGGDEQEFFWDGGMEEYTNILLITYLRMGKGWSPLASASGEPLLIFFHVYLVF